MSPSLHHPSHPLPSLCPFVLSLPSLCPFLLSETLLTRLAFLSQSDILTSARYLRGPFQEVLGAIFLVGAAPNERARVQRSRVERDLSAAAQACIAMVEVESRQSVLIGAGPAEPSCSSDL